MKKFNKRLICLFVLMALTFSFSIVATAETTDKVTGYDHGLQKQNMPDALNPTLEKEKLNEYMENNQSHVYTNNGNIIKLAPNEKIILSFDDGSRIEYSLRVEPATENYRRNVVPSLLIQRFLQTTPVLSCTALFLSLFITGYSFDRGIN